MRRLALLPALMCLAAIYFILNSGFIAVAVRLNAGQSAPNLEDALPVAVAQLLCLCIDGHLPDHGRSASWLGAVAIVLPILVVLHRTLHASFGRLEDANRHLKQMDRLYLSTIRNARHGDRRERRRHAQPRAARADLRWGWRGHCQSPTSRPSRP